MDVFIILIYLLSLLGSIILFIVALINPKLLKTLTKKPLSRKKAALFFGGLLILIIFLGALVPSPKQSSTYSAKAESKKQVEPSSKTTLSSTNPSPISKPKDQPAITSQKVMDKIKNIAAEKYPNFEITIWNKKLEFASEGETPYEVILNGSLNKPAVSSCDEAKKLSYYILETFYKDNEIRPTLSRIMITIPYYLRVSLGASDGVPMAQKGSFSDPTNFWKVMEQFGLGENEKGEMKNRTWGNYLIKCN